MILIAHRGLFNGPDKELENRPDQIELAVSRGFEVEVDIWWHENNWWLGHDGPNYQVSQLWLRDTPGLWVHAKNIDALKMLAPTDLNYFWHESDAVTITSQGYFWTYPGQQLTTHSIMVMPEMVDPTLKTTQDVYCYGICSDYVEVIANKETL